MLTNALLKCGSLMEQCKLIAWRANLDHYDVKSDPKRSDWSAGVTGWGRDWPVSHLETTGMPPCLQAVNQANSLPSPPTYAKELPGHSHQPSEFASPPYKRPFVLKQNTQTLFLLDNSAFPFLPEELGNGVVMVVPLWGGVGWCGAGDSLPGPKANIM